MSVEIAAKLRTLFLTFQESYRTAITGFAASGLACDGLSKQAEDYGVLINAVCIEAKSESQSRAAFEASPGDRHGRG